MIGKPAWFSRRKYTGWGFTPSTWQGWVYLLVAIAPLALFSTRVGDALGTAGTVFLVAWYLVFAFDFIDIVTHLPKDERDRLHEALSERNTLWAILAVLVIGAGYQAASGYASSGVVPFDPVILFAIVAGVVVKAASNLYLDKRD